MSSTKTTDSLFSAYKPKPIVEPTTTIVAPTTPKSTDPSLFEDTTAPIVNPSLYSDEGLGVNPPVTSDNYTDHMNSMAQANAQVDANGNPVYATYSYNPQNNTYTADYSAFGLTGDYATETFTSEQFLADNDRTFASMEGYEPLGPTLYYVEEDLNGGLISAPIYDTRMESEKSTDGLLEEKEEEETDAVDPSLYSDEGLGVNPLLEEGEGEEGEEEGEWTLPEYAYGVKVSDDPALAAALQRQHDNPDQEYFPLLEHYKKLDQANNYEWGEATQYTSTEEGLANYGTELANMEEQFREHTALNNAKLMRNEGYQESLLGYNPAGINATAERMLAYLETNNIPLSKEINGQTVYLNLGNDIMQAAADQIYYSDSGFDPADESRTGQTDGKFKDFAEVGTYSTVYIPPEGAWDNPFMNIAGVLVPQFGVMLTVMKGLSGETLHASDWAKVAGPALEAAGFITPPAVDSNGIPLPNAAGTGIDTGIGLLGTTYEQTQAIISAAGQGDFSGAVTAVLGGDFLATVGFDSNTLSDMAGSLGTTTEVLNNGLANILSDIATGSSLEEAIVSSGFLALIEDFENEGQWSQAIFDATGVLGDTLGEWGSVLQESLLDPAMMVLGDVLPLEELVNGFNNASSWLVDGLDAVTSGAMDLLGSFTDDQSGLTMEDLVVNIGNATGDTLETIMDAAGISFAEWLEASPQEQQQMYNQLSNFYSDITDLFDEEPDFTPPDVSTIPEDTTDDVEDTTDDVEDTTDEFTDEYFENLYNTYGDALDTLTSETGVNIEDLISGAGTSLEELANATGVSIQELLGGAETSLSDLADATGQTIEELLDNAGTSLEELADSYWYFY